MLVHKGYILAVSISSSQNEFGTSGSGRSLKKPLSAVATAFTGMSSDRISTWGSGKKQQHTYYLSEATEQSHYSGQKKITTE